MAIRIADQFARINTKYCLMRASDIWDKNDTDLQTLLDTLSGNADAISILLARADYDLLSEEEKGRSTIYFLEDEPVLIFKGHEYGVSETYINDLIAAATYSKQEVDDLLAAKMDSAFAADDAGKILKIDDAGAATPSTLAIEEAFYQKASFTNAKQALDFLIDKALYVSLSLTSFNMTPSETVYEKGYSIPSLFFEWELNKDVEEQTLTDCVIDKDAREATTTNPITTNQIFELMATDGVKTVRATKSVGFYNKIYWGYLPDGGDPQLTSATVLGLSNNRFITGEDIKGYYHYTDDGTSREDLRYIVVCYPDSFGQLPNETWYLGGFETDAVYVGRFAFTNAYGHTEDYRMYRSTQKIQGSLNMEVR